MSNNIRGLKRQSIIDNWLNGVEDPNFEVVPTRAEGKYIVKQRTGNNKTLATENMNNGPSEPQIASKQDDNSQIAKQEVENSTNKDVSA